MTLLDVIKNDENTRKVFGEAEINIIKKQLLGIKLTQSEKNRLSRDIRPKLEFIKSCCPFKDEFKLKKGGEIIKNLEILKETAILDEKGRDIKKIYLFGSYVENNMSEESDVDVSIEFEKITKEEGFRFKKRIIQEIKDLFDISIYNFLPRNIKEEVSKNGKVIYSIERETHQSRKKYN